MQLGRLFTPPLTVPALSPRLMDADRSRIDDARFAFTAPCFRPTFFGMASPFASL
jgi:hypothetical protein